MDIVRCGFGVGPFGVEMRPGIVICQGDVCREIEVGLICVLSSNPGPLND